jgi:23S rRNA (pseudouridine1915-N3)-methyltransferase
VKIEVLALGDKMPPWVNEGVNTYLKRLPPSFEVALTALPLSKRSKTDTLTAQKKESQLMLSKIKKTSVVIALDVKGKQLTSHQMADNLKYLSENHASIQLLIGGPEGLSKACLEKAHEKWSLSLLTYAHPVVRIVIAESLYRSYTLINNHPYHK